MERIINRLPPLFLAICWALGGLLSNGIGQEVSEQVTLHQLKKAASNSLQTGKPVLVYMFDTT